MWFLQSAENAPPPAKCWKVRRHEQDLSLRILLNRTIVVPYQQSPLKTTKTCQSILALTRTSTTNWLTSCFPPWRNQRNPRHSNVLMPQQYASMKNFLSRLRQQKLQFEQSWYTNATYFTESLRRSCTQFYASSISEPDSKRFSNCRSPHNGTIASTAESYPTYDQPHNNIYISTAR